METLLAGLRALDLTGEQGYFCGQVLAKLGVEVIKVERPGGDPGRSVGPFAGDIPGPERSLAWFAGNAGKKAITLDIETPRGRELLLQLAANADFLLESFAPGHLDSLGLDYATLSARNPGLIVTSITPFGPTGPYRDYAGTDLVVSALAGVLSLIGPPDLPPSRMPGELSYAMGGAHAALGTMVAFQQRELTGKGQRVHASLFEALVQCFYRATAIWDNDRILLLRQNFYRGPDGVTQRDGSFPTVWDCADGRVFYAIDFTLPKTLLAPQVLLQWMYDDGHDAGELGQVDWDNFDAPTMLTPERRERWTGIIQAFLNRHTLKELFEEGMVRRLGFAPIFSLPDVLESVQLEERNYWHDVEHKALGRSITYPGHLFLSSETECPLPTRPPCVGEHNREVFANAGLSAAEIDALEAERVI